MASQSLLFVDRVLFNPDLPYVRARGLPVANLCLMVYQYSLLRIVKIIVCGQDWYDCSSASAVRTWSRDDPAEEPWKDAVSPLRQIPGADDPWRIRTDPAHTFAIQGFGSGMATSAVILLARLGVVPGRSTQDRLDVLYASFIQWCHDHGKSSSLDGFSLLKFKMKTFLA